MPEWSTPKPEDLAALKSYQTPAPEDRYAAWFQQQEAKLPKSIAPYVPTSLAPQTPAELATSGAQIVGKGAMALGTALSPETFGTSMIPALAINYGLPLATAGTVGAWEAPPGQRWARSKQEMEKAAIGLALAKPIEWAMRLPSRIFANRQMLAKSASRIMRGAKALLSEYPEELDTPNTMQGIRRDVAGGKLKDVVGRRLGAFRKELEDKIPAYKPAQPATVVHGLQGPITTPGASASGEAFTVFTPDANGDMVPKQVSIGEAIEHVQKENGLGYSAGGSDTGGPLSWAHRKAGHMSRESIYTRLNQIGGKYKMPNAGDLYRQHSGDAGAAEILTDAFTNAQRTLGAGGEALPVIDQPALNKRIAKEMDHLRKLQPERVDAFSTAVAPTGGSAVPAGTRWIRPFLPESRKMYGLPTRAATKLPTILAPEVGRTVPASPLAGLALQRAEEKGMHVLGLSPEDVVE